MSKGSKSGRVSCCQGCENRKVGCHDVKTCAAWAAEVERRKAQREAREAQRPVTRRSWEDRKMVGP